MMSSPPVSKAWKIAALLVPILGNVCASAQSLPAFPGAEGFGACSTGGRGGDVYTVANLNASGPGSFAEGLATAPPQGRTIVFAVSGYIPIRKLKLKASNITIAGQTAPGDGVALRGSIFWISGSNVVIRFMRFRRGVDRDGGDCVETDSGARNLLLDHCDAMFSTDENFSMFKTAPPTMTFQWSINAWGLQTHSAGGLWMVDHTTVHHSLWAHNHTRNPKVIRPLAFDWANNVTFGWDIGMNLAGADVPGAYKVNLRGSTFIHGGKARDAVFGGGQTNGVTSFHVHVSDCAFDGNGNGRLDVSAADHNIIAKDSLYHKQPAPFPQTLKADPAAPRDPVLGVPVTLDDRATAYKKVLSHVGPLRLELDPAKPLRDEADALLIRDVAQQHRRIISHEKELGLGDGGCGALKSAPAPVDGDGDGMPDYYETALGWEATKQDHNTPLAGNGGKISGVTFFPTGTAAGYTRLEEYLHFCASPHGVVASGGSVMVDLKKFTSGFTASPKFTVAQVLGGSVMTGGPGGSQVTFKPAPGHTGRARFDFTVRDSEGSQWTQTCVLVVLKP